MHGCVKEWLGASCLERGGEGQISLFLWVLEERFAGKYNDRGTQSGIWYGTHCFLLWYFPCSGWRSHLHSADLGCPQVLLTYFGLQLSISFLSSFCCSGCIYTARWCGKHPVRRRGEAKGRMKEAQCFVKAAGKIWDCGETLKLCQSVSHYYHKYLR